MATKLSVHDRSDWRRWKGVLADVRDFSSVAAYADYRKWVLDCNPDLTPEQIACAWADIAIVRAAEASRRQNLAHDDQKFQSFLNRVRAGRRASLPR